MALQGDLLGVTGQVERAATGGQNIGFRRPPATKIAALRLMMSSCSPRNVIAATRERGPFTAHCESLPIGRDSRSAGTSDRGPSGVSLRVFIEKEGEGS
jgi:hypothetical protein